MPSRLIECPQCGAPTTVESGARFARCTFCGSELELARGPTMRPASVLDDIREGTGILARRAAAHHLQERLAALAREHAAVWAQWQRETQSAAGIPHSAPMRTRGSAVSILVGSALIVVGGVLALFRVASGATIALAGAALVAAGVLVGVRLGKTLREDRRQFVRRALSDAEGRYGPRIAAIEEEIRSARERVAGIEAEMDLMTRDL